MRDHKKLYGTLMPRSSIGEVFFDTIIARIQPDACLRMRLRIFARIPWVALPPNRLNTLSMAQGTPTAADKV